MGIKEEIREKKEQIRKVTLPKDELIKKYLDGEPYDLNQIAIEVKYYYKRGIEATIEIGKRLLVVKEIEGEGKFSEWLRNNFRFSERTAYNLIGIIKEMSPEVVKSISQQGISKTKLYDIKRLPKEELNKLEEKGALIEIPLEEIKDMSTRQLRNKINQFLAKINKQQEQIEDGNKQLQKQEEEIERLKNRDAEMKFNEVEIGFSKMIRIVNGLLASEEVTKVMWKEALRIRETFDLRMRQLIGKHHDVISGYEDIISDEDMEVVKRKAKNEDVSAQ